MGLHQRDSGVNHEGTIQGDKKGMNEESWMKETISNSDQET